MLLDLGAAVSRASRSPNEGPHALTAAYAAPELLAARDRHRRAISTRSVRWPGRSRPARPRNASGHGSGAAQRGCCRHSPS